MRASDICLLHLMSVRYFCVRGHSFSTFAQTGRGSSKSVRHAYKGEEACTWKYVRNNVRFLHVFCDIFICRKLLPYFVVFGVDFHYCFIKNLL